MFTLTDSRNISSYDSQRAIWLDVGPTGSPFNEQALAVFFKPIIHDVHEATKKSLYDLSHGTVNDCTIMGISIPDYWPKIVRDVILDAIESKCGAFPLTEKTSGQASFVAYNFGPCLAKQKPWLMLVIEVNQDVTVLEIVDVGGHENMKEKSWAIGNGDALLGKDKDSYITQLKQGLLPLTKACRTRLELKAVILTGELEPSRVPELHSELLTIFHDVPVNDFGPVYTQVSPRYVGAWGAARAFRIAINKQLDSNDSLALDIVTPLIIQ